MSGVNFESTLEFIEFLRHCKETDVEIDFYRDTYNKVPIKTLMEFTLVGCIPKFVRNITDYSDKKLFIVDVPTDEEGKLYERKQYIITTSPDKSIESAFTALITDDIIPNILKVNLENVDSDIFNIALECCHTPNQVYSDAKFITFLTRKIKLLEAQLKLHYIYDTDECSEYDQSVNSFSDFTWKDANSDNDNIKDDNDNDFIFKGVEPEEQTNELLNNKLDTDIDDTINDETSYSTKGIDDNKHDMKFNDISKNKLDLFSYIQKNKDKTELKRDSVEMALNECGDTIRDIKPNSFMINDINIDDIIIVTYTINGESTVTIGVDDGDFVTLVGDPANTKISKSFVDKIYKIGNNLILLIKAMFMYMK